MEKKDIEKIVEFNVIASEGSFESRPETTLYLYRCSDTSLITTSKNNDYISIAQTIVNCSSGRNIRVFSDTKKQIDMNPNYPNDFIFVRNLKDNEMNILRENIVKCLQKRSSEREWQLKIKP